MKTVAVGLVVCALALGSIGCASFPPKKADGTLDVRKFVKQIEYGIVADCAINGAEQDVCAVGLPLIQALEDGTPDTILPALQKIKAQYPHTAGWINYAIKALGGTV